MTAPALPDITLIVAHTVPGRVIGAQGGMPWHLPADLAHFKSVTLGHPVLMGRRTHESIGRPLPLRTNLVISRQQDYTAPACQVFPDLATLWRHWSFGPDLFVIGGATLYAALLPLATRLMVTEIHADIDGDTHFPLLDPDHWVETGRQERPADDQNAHDLSFTTLIRRPI